MILGDNLAGHGFVLRDLVLIELFQISHNCVGKIFVKTYLKAIRDFFPIYGISQYVTFLSNRRGKFKLLGLQGDPPPPQFPRIVGYPDLPMRKTLRVVCLLTIMIFLQRKKITAFKIKDEKDETIFHFLMVFHPFESKEHLTLS